MEKQTKAYLFAVATVSFWSTVASAFKISLRYVSPVELLFYSTLFSTLVLFGVLVVRNKLSLLGTGGRSVWMRSVLLGTLNPFLYYLILFKAYELLPAQQAQPLNYTWAITLSLLAVVFLGHPLSVRQLVAIAVSYGGVYIIATKGAVFSLEFERPLGVVLALGSTVVWALYWLLNTRDTRDPVVGLFLNFLCSIPLITAYLAVTEGFRPIPPVGAAGAAYVGCFEMGISFVTWLMAMKLTDSAAKVANLIFLSPFFSLLLIHLVVGETIHPSSVVGLLFIVAGLMLQSFEKRSV